MKKTVAQLSYENITIPSEEIEQDIKDTQEEIDSYKIILKELYKHPQENRVEIYLKEGNILKREHFIDDLKSILEYRTTLLKQVTN